MRFSCIILICFAAMLFTGCVHNPKNTLSVSTDPLKNYVGQRVTLVGFAELRKGGVVTLRGDDFYVWIDESDELPRTRLGHRVHAVGVLEERHDLPVFVQKPGELPQQGIPVPEDSDLRWAGRRYVLRDAKWRLLHEP